MRVSHFLSHPIVAVTESVSIVLHCDYFHSTSARAQLVVAAKGRAPVKQKNALTLIASV